MGILRADRVSGLGGANAINGSVHFNGNHLDISGVDTAFGTGGNWTMECWINPQEVALKAITDPRTGGSTVHPLLWISGGNGGKAVGVLYYYTAGADRIVGTTVLKSGTWYHVAVVRNNGTTHLYVNGTSEGSFSDTLDYASTPTFRIGARYSSTPYNYNGYISNFRLINGTALYTANFTPPAQRLENISGTEILCCQSPGNVLQEATGKTLNVRRVNSNNAPPMASHFAPDKGEDHGTTFADNTKFDTLSYMVPPGGTTTQRGRGRGLLMGGAVSPGATNTTQIKYFDIASQGITDDFGQTSVARRSTGSLSSSTRAVMGGGFVAPPSPYTISDVMDYVTIATTANATDFGNMQSTGYSYGTASNETRGLFAGGYRPNNSAVVNTIDLITIATTGNASNFGDLVVARRSFGGLASPTRGIFMGGAPSVKEEIDYVTIATAGNANDFGNLTDGRDNVYGSSNSTRGVMGGGRNPNNTNIIDYITIATTGNATDFGDLIAAMHYYAATGNSTRTVWVGDTNISNIMEYVTIATTGNSVDWGDQGGTPQHSSGACSDSHGGIS